ncbi:IL-6 subfamily cytokine M17 precursor [Danio rerio]|uniref:Ciliary neurotrophic factor n=1 Tax=Danio rerio TaxID=7955 RepID=A0PAS6_DANRE|nr:IL-6 subfamily cytokine M17 precursor [Danio rerio]BAF38020.1 leukemia inhibitory factor-like [Danio rerio]|eukprot:NP_001073302.1 IL-6 subfamily cytokine M17 precursor [Danio rerio]
MLCLSQRLQVKFRAYFAIIILIAVQLVQPTMSCKNENCSQRLHRSLKLNKFTNKMTVKLLDTYKASQGDSTDLICEMQMDNVPVSTISGQTESERILSMYSHLKAFLPHLKTVMEQQRDLDPPTNPVTEGINSLITHVRHMAVRVNCLLQILQPNIPIPEPAERPTGIPPAQNIFQQKVYGCIVLTRLQQLLSQAVQEQKSLKGKTCRRTKKNYS